MSTAKTSVVESNKVLIPAEWSAAAIGDLCVLFNGRAFKQAEWETHGVPIIRIQNLNKPNAPFNYYQGALDERHKIRKGDLLFAWSGTPGTSFGTHEWGGEDAALNQHIFKIQISEHEIDKVFFRHAIDQKLDELIGSANGGVGLRHVTKGTFEKTIVAFPPLAEQKAIAEKLDSLLAQVETTKARLDRIPVILKRFRQSVLAAAVSGKLTSSGEVFKSLKVEETWSHEVEGLRSWDEYKFSDVVNIVGGSQPPKSEFKNEYIEGYIRLIQIRDYKSDRNVVYIPKEKAKRFVGENDVMIGRYGPPIFQILRGLEGAYNVALMKAEPKKEVLDNEFLYWYLQNYKIFSYIEAGSDRTAGQSGVNKKHLESYPILLPSLDEQKQIVSKVEVLFAHTDAIEIKVKAAQKRVKDLTQSILAKAFRGELTAEWRAENPELITGENSAEALLAKIKTEREAAKPIRKKKKKA